VEDGRVGVDVIRGTVEPKMTNPLDALMTKPVEVEAEERAVLPTVTLIRGSADERSAR